MKKLFIEKKLWDRCSVEAVKKLRKCKTLTLASAIILNKTEDELLEDEDAIYENIGITMFRTSNGVYFQTVCGSEEYIEVGSIEID